MLKVGMQGSAEKISDQTTTASNFGSGGVDVFATPVMIGLMEESACNAVHSALPVGQTTVGTTVNIKHIAATPIGMKVRGEALLTQIDGRRLVFQITAYDEKEKIGEGEHERFIIDLDKFMQRVNQKTG